MKILQYIGVMVMVGGMVTLTAAQRRGGMHAPPPSHSVVFGGQHGGQGRGPFGNRQGPPPQAQAQRNSGKAAAPGPQVRDIPRQGPGPHAGDWLRRYRDVPPAQQERMLENDPQFQRLPPDRQQMLKQRLQKFSSLPPDKQQRILNRMETWEHLPPQERQRAIQLWDRVRAMPPDRRHAMMEAYHNMRDMDPAEQQRMLQSPDMRNNFSDGERDTLRQALQLGVGPGHHGGQDGVPRPPNAGQTLPDNGVPRPPDD